MHVARLHLAGIARWLLLALLVPLVPATAHAGVFISVGFAPPPLLVYDQPPCPEPGLMWTPGYWAYGPDGYYWVPGAWVPAPYVGAYWTPGYWGWGGGLYIWHPGYWGPHVGYYGGVDYGFGYMGIGFVGGMWRGGVFAYNTAVMRVGPGIRNVYVNRTIVERNTIVNERHVAFSGGPGGINHPPTAQERAYMNERHMGPTAAQSQHMQSAMHNHNAYYNVNHGHPSQVAVARPLGGENRGAAAGHNAYQQDRGAQSRPMQQERPQQEQRPMQGEEARPQSRPQEQPMQRQEARPQSRPMQQERPQQEQRPMQRQEARPQSRPQERPQQRREERQPPRNDSHDHR